MMTEVRSEDEATMTAQEALNKRLESIAWAVFLISIGVGTLLTMLLGPEQVPVGLGGVVTGLILLGLNVARYAYGIKMSGGTLVLGALALLSGIGDLAGVNVPILAIVLIGAGIYSIIKPWWRRSAD
ncbi:MAG: hypothetical protein JXA74_17630 [Anaerolineae bacterium]|nr:hypothetical protein [Anaerolineae bacterium]